MSPAKRRSPSLPDRRELVAFIDSSERPVGKREIARAFRIGSEHRVWLKDMLRDLAEEGLIERGGRRRLSAPDSLPEVTVVEIVRLDRDGDPLAAPPNWNDADGPAPRIVVTGEHRKGPAPGIGDRCLARLSKQGHGVYEAKILKLLPGAPQRMLGVYEHAPSDALGGGIVRPTDRKTKTGYRIADGMAGGARSGDLVLVAPLPHKKSRWRSGPPYGEIVEILGDGTDPKSPSLIAIHRNRIPVEFSAESLCAAEKAGPVTRDGGVREDLRETPLVTIDGADARDFDDAVWAMSDPDPANPGGWRMIVAIADVSYYVRPGDPLDCDAFKRGNSAYFPDRVVPMLPERLSNGWCSLNPNEDRGCLAVEIRINEAGDKIGHRFLRGLMRSSARLTYEITQRIRDGAQVETPDGLDRTTIDGLYGAYEALMRARRRRGALELDLPERRIELDGNGRVTTIWPRERLDSHRLIEEFMIQANVCAAETLEERAWPCMYRIHDDPNEVKLAALAETLRTVGLKLNPDRAPSPKALNGVLRKAADVDLADMASNLVLRAQSQAEYSSNNIGHFGLALRRYAHFTSPIRRYSDLLVHRALVAALKLGPGGLPAKEPEAEANNPGFRAIGEHISVTERRAMAAERDANDRYVASYMAEKVGGSFRGRVTGVARFGLFIKLNETAADGLAPMSKLPADYYDIDESRQALIGRSAGRVYRLGQPVEVRLIEADGLTGRLVLELLEELDGIGPAHGGKGGTRGPTPRSRPGPRAGRGKNREKSNIYKRSI